MKKFGLIFFLSLTIFFAISVDSLFAYTESFYDGSYLYMRYYVSGYTTEQLLYDRSGPRLRREIGLKNKFNLPWEIKLNLDFVLQGSIIGLTDPAEQWRTELSFERRFWKKWNFKAGYDQQHNISRLDENSPDNDGLNRTYFEIGWFFK